MAGQWGDLKTVVTDNAVATELANQTQTYPRLAEAWDALEWLLARSAATIGRAPNNGDPNLRLYAQAQDLIANIPAIWVIYRVGDEIEILAANFPALQPIDVDAE